MDLQGNCHCSITNQGLNPKANITLNVKELDKDVSYKEASIDIQESKVVH